MGKGLGLQASGPEFEFQTPCKKPGTVAHSVIPLLLEQEGRWRQDLWKLASQLP